MPIPVDPASAPSETATTEHNRGAPEAHPSPDDSSGQFEASRLKALQAPSDTGLKTSDPAAPAVLRFDREMTRAYQDAQRLPSPVRERMLEELDRLVLLASQLGVDEATKYPFGTFGEFWTARRKRLRRFLSRYVWSKGR